jgi:hypothetical protein
MKITISGWSTSDRPHRELGANDTLCAAGSAVIQWAAELMASTYGLLRLQVSRSWRVAVAIFVARSPVKALTTR